MRLKVFKSVNTGTRSARSTTKNTKSGRPIKLLRVLCAFFVFFVFLSSGFRGEDTVFQIYPFVVSIINGALIGIMAIKKKALLGPGEIISKIYLLRGQKVMLDRDLAELYGVKNIRLREQVKRNINYFPKNFMFRLTPKEVNSMVSQNAIPSKKHLGGSMPYAFTEHGVLMLASVLKSETAMRVSIRIIEIFVSMREMLLSHKDILLQLEKIERKITGHDDDIQVIFKYLKQLLDPPSRPRGRIGFKVSNGN